RPRGAGTCAQAGRTRPCRRAARAARDPGRVGCCRSRPWAGTLLGPALGTVDVTFTRAESSPRQDHLGPDPRARKPGLRDGWHLTAAKRTLDHRQFPYPDGWFLHDCWTRWSAIQPLASRAARGRRGPALLRPPWRI